MITLGNLPYSLPAMRSTHEARLEKAKRRLAALNRGELKPAMVYVDGAHVRVGWPSPLSENFKASHE